MTDISGIAACLAEQLRLLGYVVLAPPAPAPAPVDTAPTPSTDAAPVPPQENVQEAQGATTPPATTAAPAPVSAAPVRLQEEAQDAYGAETPPATYDFTAYFDNGRAYAGAPKHDAAGPPGGNGASKLDVLFPLTKEETPGGPVRPTGHNIESFFLDTGAFAAAAARANERVNRGTGRHPGGEKGTPDAGTAGSSRDTRNAGLLMADAIVRGRTCRGQKGPTLVPTTAARSPDRLRRYATGGPPGTEESVPPERTTAARSPDRRHHSVVGGPPGTEESVSLCSTSTASSVTTMLIPSRRDTEEDGGAQPDAPFWEPAKANNGQGFDKQSWGGFTFDKPQRGLPGDQSGFGSHSGFGRCSGGFGSREYPRNTNREGKYSHKSGGKNSRKGGGKDSGPPRRPGVDVRCPACGFWRN